MLNISITHSYFLRLDPKQWKTGLPYPPLATLYAAAVLRNERYSVDVFDNMFEQSSEAICTAISENKPDVFFICDDGFNYLTKMCLTNMRQQAHAMISFAKSAGCIVVVSSSDATDHSSEYLDAGADYIIAGEVEQTIIELVAFLSTEKNQQPAIPGLIFYDKHLPIKTAPRAVMKQLDTLPMPAWDMIDIAPYRESWMKRVGYFSLNVATTRGCPFKCNWCAKPIYGNRYNSRSPEKVVEEIAILMNNYGATHIWFCDDIFGLKPGWVQQFSLLVQKAQLQFSFKIQSRADLLLQPEYIAALASAGCKTVWMGAESGSQRILDAMDKGITVEQVGIATALLKQHNIQPCFFIQFGYLGETRTDIELTLKMIHELLPHEIGISVSYPLPGTAFYDKVKSELKEKSNWTDSDELQLMFKNTYQPAFYKQLHRYVHKKYKMQLAMLHMRKLVSSPSYQHLRKAFAAFYYIPSSLLCLLQLNRLQKRVNA